MSMSQPPDFHMILYTECRNTLPTSKRRGTGNTFFLGRNSHVRSTRRIWRLQFNWCNSGTVHSAGNHYSRILSLICQYPPGRPAQQLQLLFQERSLNWQIDVWLARWI